MKEYNVSGKLTKQAKQNLFSHNIKRVLQQGFLSNKSHLLLALKAKVICKRYEFYELQEKLEEAGETLRLVFSDAAEFHLGRYVSHDNARAGVVKISIHSPAQSGPPHSQRECVVSFHRTLPFYTKMKKGEYNRILCTN